MSKPRYSKRMNGKTMTTILVKLHVDKAFIDWALERGAANRKGHKLSDRGIINWIKRQVRNGRWYDCEYEPVIGGDGYLEMRPNDDLEGYEVWEGER